MDFVRSHFFENKTSDQSNTSFLNLRYLTLQPNVTTLFAKHFDGECTRQNCLYKYLSLSMYRKDNTGQIGNCKCLQCVYISVTSVGEFCRRESTGA